MATKVKLIADNAITTTQIDTSSLDSHFSGGTGVTYSSGEISIGQAVHSTDSPTFADLTLTGNLNITGDLNSYNVTDLDVTDQTITLGAGQTEALSGGSGIIVDGSNASILWDETNDVFDINKGLTALGNVGIGESNPQELLHIYGTDPVIRVSDDGTTGFPSLQLLQQNVTTEGTELLYDSSTGHTHLNTSYATGDIRFGTATGTLGSISNVRMTIDHTGNVGIGTTDPSYQLHIVNSSGIAEMELDGSQAAELNLKDGNSAENTRRGRLTLDQSRLRLEGLNDADDTVTHKGFTLVLDDGQMYIGDYTDLYGGGAGESGLTINVRNPSDVDRGTVSILDNETAYNSTPQASISFGGKYNTSGDQTFFSRIVGYKANTTSGNATGALGFNLRSGTSSLHTALDLITGAGGAGGVLQFPATNVGAPDLNDRIDGTRINWYNASGSTAWYATGISSNTLWHIADVAHRWYAGTSGTPTQVLRVTPEGLSIPTAASDGTGTNTGAGLQAGQIYYNTTNNNFKGYNGSSWFDITSSDLTSISTLELWADVTAGISSTTVSDLSGNNRTATLSSTTNKGTLAGNTYFLVDSASDSIVYAHGTIPDYTPAVTYFFIMTNRKSLSNYGSYITSSNAGSNYNIIRHQSTGTNYNFYFANVTNNTFSSPTVVPPVNATINEAVCMIFSWRPQATGTVDIYKYENGVESSESYNTQVGNMIHNWDAGSGDVRIGTSSWAQEYMNAGFFAWGILSDEASSTDRQIIYNYYKAKGLLT